MKHKLNLIALLALLAASPLVGQEQEQEHELGTRTISRVPSPPIPPGCLNMPTFTEWATDSALITTDSNGSLLYTGANQTASIGAIGQPINSEPVAFTAAIRNAYGPQILGLTTQGVLTTNWRLIDYGIQIETNYWYIFEGGMFRPFYDPVLSTINTNDELTIEVTVSSAGAFTINYIKKEQPAYAPQIAYTTHTPPLLNSRLRPIDLPEYPGVGFFSASTCTPATN